MFPTHPVGGSPYSSPPYSPTTMPWAQQGLLGNQWAAPAVAPWPTMPGSVAPWTPVGIAAPPAGSQIKVHGSQPGVVTGGNTPASPTALNGYPTPLNSLYASTVATGPLQSASPTLGHNLLLWWSGHNGKIVSVVSITGKLINMAWWLLICTILISFSWVQENLAAMVSPYCEIFIIYTNIFVFPFTATE